MTEGKLKLIILLITGCFLLSFFSGRKNVEYGNINITSFSKDASEGLDLKVVGEILKEAKDAEDFERILNKKDGVNNLDLNGDNKVDYIQITEYGDEELKGFSLTVEPAKGETQEIATIEVEKDAANDKAEVYVSGNKQIYGDNYYYRDSFSFSRLLLFSYMFSPHRSYFSPYGYGYYPSYYGRGYSTVNNSRYNNRTSSYQKNSTSKKTSTVNRKSNISSPNKGKTAKKGIRRSLRKPTKSQKSFQTKSLKKARSGGFGRSSRPSRPSVRSRGFGRSGGFGFGK